jgi:sterol desaturase/sphingolipid hydroxylase (fatty acid hydroxylase superfamily)
MTLTEYLLAHQDAVRLIAFAGVFLVMAAWEALAPRRTQIISRWLRWPNNIGVILVGVVLVRFVFPGAAVGAAAWAHGQGLGLFNRLALPEWISVAGSVLILDLAIYGQHVAFHAAAPLWRLHRMHHADLEIDVTTGTRFHPVEILLSMAIKMAIVVAIGAPAMAVVLFEVLLNATSMFNHSNVRVPDRLDRVLRYFLVTPDMHRVHHSIERRETDSNFGFNLPWWDRLFGTYRAQPTAGHDGMTIGIPQFRASGELRLDRMLMQPLRDNEGGKFGF